MATALTTGAIGVLALGLLGSSFRELPCGGIATAWAVTTVDVELPTG
jgi:hypothetical protein